MLHQCNFDRTMYNNIGKQLADNGLHAVSLDFRGFGKSTNDQFDIARLETLSEIEQQKFMGNLYQHWPSDVLEVLALLKTKVGEGGRIGVIGASCGGSLALRLTDQVSFSAIGLFSSAQGNKNIARYEKNLKSLPTYLIAAEEDVNAYASAQKIFAHASHPASKLVTYKGAGHGYILYEQDNNLEQAIANWLVQHL